MAHLKLIAEAIDKKIFQGSVTAVGPFDMPLLSLLSGKDFVFNELNLSRRIENELFPYLETIQLNLVKNTLLSKFLDKPTQDLIVCRYLLEHCTDPVGALINLQSILSPNGYLLIEVPDSTKFITSRDISFIWEEHITYFCHASLENLVKRAGYEIIEEWNICGPLEDALVVLLKPNSSVCVSPRGRLPTTGTMFDDFVNCFSADRAQLIEKLQAVLDTGKKIALFGAGHQAAMFVNAHGIEHLIKMVVDDAPHKHGYCLPGTKLSIVSSAEMLADKEIGLCLTTVNPSVEKIVADKLQAIIANGASVRSIFPASPTAYISHTKCN
jgi:SAM-dependent methyltransferase